MEPVNLPDVEAEVAAALELYEDALVNNKVDVLDGLFWNSPRTVRFVTHLDAGEDAVSAAVERLQPLLQ